MINLRRGRVFATYVRREDHWTIDSYWQDSNYYQLRDTSPNVS
jgi:hypothetical protein